MTQVYDTEPAPPPLPDLLNDDASIDDVVRAVNGLADEIQLVRIQVQRIGTRIGELGELIEKVLAAKVRNP